MALVTMKALPKATGISRASLYRLIDEGLPYTTVGAKRMYDPTQVMEFVANRKSKLEQPLTVGQAYTNQEIVELFRVRSTGGIRKSNTKHSLVLLSYHIGSNRVHHDYWRDGTLYFTGEGLEGDQRIDRGVNRALAQSEKNSFTVHLFELFTEPSFHYRGIVRLAGTAFQKQEKDTKGVLRTVWKFPLQLVNARDCIPREVLSQQRQQAESELSRALVRGKLSKPLLELARSADRVVSEVATTSNSYMRSPILSRFSKQRANGICELCSQPAPFWVGGEPFLELHHIIPVSEGGRDSANNVTALCPNCHRRVHCLKSPQDMERIRENIEVDNWVLNGWSEEHLNLRRALPCPHCGRRTPVDLREFVLAHTQTSPQGQRTVYTIDGVTQKCIYCAKALHIHGHLSESTSGTLDGELLKVTVEQKK